MGILDDAIKEHLELKRRRGADPNEMERLEREALGPVRRGPQPADDVFAGAEVVEQEGAEPALYDDEVDEGFAEPPELSEEPAFAGEAGHEAFPEDESEEGWSHEPADGWSEAPLASEDPATAEAEALAPAEPAAHAPAPSPAEPAYEEPAYEEPAHEESTHAGGETVEYDVEAEELGKGEQDDDVLEETPEFLQDTPDHDRLWFEQRPPKDFDFDK